MGEGAFAVGVPTLWNMLPSTRRKHIPKSRRQFIISTHNCIDHLIFKFGFTGWAYLEKLSDPCSKTPFLRPSSGHQMFMVGPRSAQPSPNTASRTYFKLTQ